jgi:hypothetical protein
MKQSQIWLIVIVVLIITAFFYFTRKPATETIVAPIIEVPEINPTEKVNPLQNVYQNPFE